MYSLEFTAESTKALRRMPRNIAALILDKLNKLTANPSASNNNLKRLKGSNDFRMRVGDWRVVYTVENDRLVITVVRVAPRGGVYD